MNYLHASIGGIIAGAILFILMCFLLKQPHKDMDTLTLTGVAFLLNVLFNKCQLIDTVPRTRRLGGYIIAFLVFSSLIWTATMEFFARDISVNMAHGVVASISTVASFSGICFFKKNAVKRRLEDYNYEVDED